jgi:hypothetical protein
MEKTKLVALIGSIGRTAAKLTKDVQLAAVNVVLHAIAHGDVTLADSLVDALGKQGRKSSLRAWFEINGCMVVSSSTQKFILDKSRKATMAKLVQSELEAKLMELPWVEAIPEPKAITILEVGAMADKFLERLTKQVKEAEGSGVKVNGKALLDFLVTQTAKYHAAEILNNPGRVATPDLVGPLEPTAK